VNKMKKAALAVAATAVVAAPVATVASTTGSAEAATAANSRAKVGHVADGDTFRLSDGTYVRLIGYDTAETGSGCLAKAQTYALKRLIKPGDSVRLVHPASEPDKDQYGRLLRYVRVDNNLDVGSWMIRNWGAQARYDSTDGYSHHPLEEKYHRLDAHHSYTCDQSPAPAPAPAPTPSGDTTSYPPASLNTCPSYAPIKGNADSMIYHMPGQRYYAVTNPEECFATEAAAQAHGYRRALV
jgi:endonuclease YncB( thermonuclease family)